MQIDSYVSERKRNRKKRYRYFWSIVIFLGIYFIFLIGVIFIVRWPAFQAERIVVQGNSEVSQGDIMSLLQASVINKHDSIDGTHSGVKALLGFDNMLIWPSGLPSSTLSLLPQLADLTIGKDYFLHTITVTVTEREPFALWCSMPTAPAPAAAEAGATEDESAAAPSTALGVSDGNCFWFDNTGMAFERGVDAQGGSFMVIDDYSQNHVVLGGNVLPDVFLPNLLSILGVLRQSGLAFTEISLQDIDLQQIDVTTLNGPALYFSLRFPADEDLPVLTSLMAKPGFDNLQYIDFTVQNRAYYK